MKQQPKYIRILFRILPGIFLMILFFGCQEELLQHQNESVEFDLKSSKITDFMVITKSETLPPGLEKKLGQYGQVVNSIPEIGVVVLRSGIPDVEKELGKLPEVRSVVPDLKTKWINPVKVVKEENPPSIGDDEPFFFYQWGMDAINAPEAWNAGYKGGKAKVFVLDSGIDPEHIDLASNVNKALSTSFVPGEEYYVQNMNDFNHGTHVAGIVAAAHNGFGVIGVAPEAEIIAVKVLSEADGSGAFSWINAGIVYAANYGADVINMSLGARFNRNGFYYDEYDNLVKIPAVYMQELILAQQRAVNYAWRKGVVIITSAGNGGSNADGNASIFIIPAELQNVVSVSATAPDYWFGDIVAGKDPNLDIPASYTDYGRSLINIAAPGGDFDYYPQPNWQFDLVLSTGPGNSFWFAAGTSMAAPHAAGVTALIISKYDGKLNPQAVVKKLQETADKPDGNGMSAFFGKGRVNAYRAVTE